MSKTIRLFIAIPISEELSEAIGLMQEHLQRYPALRDLNWADAADSHITIRFLGETEVALLPQLVETLDKIAQKWDSFPVKVEGCGSFPNAFRPNVFWLGVSQGEKQLKILFEQVENGVRELGIWPERRAYLPHLTLARVPQNWTQGEKRMAGELITTIPLPRLPTVTVSRVVLMRSTLTANGPVYTRLGNSHFGSAQPLKVDDSKVQLD